MTVSQELVLGLAGGSVPVVLTGLGWLAKHLLTGKRRRVEVAAQQEEVAQKLLARVKASYEAIIHNLEERIDHVLRKVRGLEERRDRDGKKILELTQHRDECEHKLARAERKLDELQGRVNTVEVQVRNGGSHG